jgi:hypothetical protein
MIVPRQSSFTSHRYRRWVVSVGMTSGLAAAPLAQTPPTAPYQEEEVTFTNGEVKLAGSLSLPAGEPYAAVLPPSANRPSVEAALSAAKNPNVTTKVYPEANHVFIKSVPGNPSEYPTLDKTFVPGFLNDLSTWILLHAKR